MYTNFCAFVTYTYRQSAENAMNALFNSLYIKGHRYKLGWGNLSALHKSITRGAEEGQEVEKRHVGVKDRKIEYGADDGLLGRKREVSEEKEVAKPRVKGTEVAKKRSLFERIKKHKLENYSSD